VFKIGASRFTLLRGQHKPESWRSYFFLYKESMNPL
jgi:hypothetical protein